jgi:hypothetical protein
MESPQVPIIQNQFHFLFNELTSMCRNLCPQLIRVLLLAMCTAIIKRSLLILVRDVDDFEIVERVLELGFQGIIQTFYPSKTLLSNKTNISCLLSCENGIALIPRYDILTRSSREKLDRAIAEKSIGGAPINASIICIAISPALDGIGHEHFDFGIRIDSLPRAYVENFMFGSHPSFDSERVVNRLVHGQSLIKIVKHSEGAEALIRLYGRWCERNSRNLSHELIIQLSVGVAAFRSAHEISEIDCMLCIYFWEEKLSSMNGDESILAQLPKTQSFCDPEISRIRTTDEDTLFHSWCMEVRKVIEL